MSNGKYHKQLYRLFQTIGITFCLVLIFLIGYRSTTVIKKQYEDSVKQNVSSGNMLSEMSLSGIHSAISVMMRDSDIRFWGSASVQSHYYYDAYIVNRRLQEIVTQFSTVPFYPAVTRLREDIFVISPTGSSKKADFFAEETNLSQEQASQALSYMAENSGEYMAPVYDADGVLTDLYYFIRPPYDRGDLIYIIRIPRNSFISADHEQSFILLHNSQVLAYSHNLPEKTARMEDAVSYINTLSHIPDDPLEPVSWQNQSIYLSRFSGSNWQIAYLYDNLHLTYLQIAIYIIVPLFILLAITGWLSRYLSNRLYTPIKEVMKEVGADSNLHEDVDEFQLLKQNVRTAKQLSDDLQNIISNNASLVTQKFYRDLILGLNVRKNPLYQDISLDQLPWCVILFEFQEETEKRLADDIFFAKNQLFAAAQDNGNHPSVNISHSICAILVQNRTSEEAKSLAITLSNAIPEKLTVKIAVSSIRSGILSLHDCYEEAKRILEYRYLYGSSEILTAGQILNTESANYFYPIVTENQLIQAIAQGNSSAFNIFDNLIRENFLHRNLTPEALKSFIYILFSTINRIFSELKTSPEELLGHSIDYENFYSHWSHPNIISDIRELIQEIITAVDSRNSNADSQMLSRMQQYIYENYSSDIMLNDMADELGITAKYCSNLFKKLSDENFKTFLNHYRIEQAKKFLNENPQMKILDLSLLVGFNSSNTFIRVFSKYTGMTPGAYAASVKNGIE